MADTRFIYHIRKQADFTVELATLRFKDTRNLFTSIGNTFIYNAILFKMQISKCSQMIPV